MQAKSYFKDGVLHRDDGPAVEALNGDNYWVSDGKLHREDGPAIELAASSLWYRRGKKHRTDGPAVEYIDGSIFWYIDGTNLAPAEFAAAVLDKETAMLWKISNYCWPFDFNLPPVC
jgi:hypothetical protein